MDIERLKCEKELVSSGRHDAVSQHDGYLDSDLLHL
jgi:hypothetical protein